ncbi:MAG: choice-of-anchor D domain-containing protein, partial [Planctomycetaceae bacterium]
MVEQCSATGTGTGSLAPEIEVTGFNLNIPDGDTTPATSDGTDFGTVPVNAEVVRTFTVKNTGTATLTLGSPTLPAGFTLGTDTLLPNISAGGFDTFDVKFSSATPGTFTGELSFTNNDSDENPYNFTVIANVSVSGTPEIDVL